MTTHPLSHTTTEGPLGFPVTDRQAFALDSLLKALPKEDAFRYRKALQTKGPAEILSGERSDVSWISTEDPDRVREVVLARGMNDSQFKQNPIVTLQHAYWLPPVGKSLWRRRVKDGNLVGIKAKTQYPPRPEAWPEGEVWPSDKVFALLSVTPTRCGVAVAAPVSQRRTCRRASPPDVPISGRLSDPAPRSGMASTARSERCGTMASTRSSRSAATTR